MKLLDIFTIHPQTACNTHDLLDCPCETSEEDGEENVLDAGIDDELSSSESEDEHPLNGFMSASQVKPSDISKLDKAVRVSFSSVIRIDMFL